MPYEKVQDRERDNLAESGLAMAIIAVYTCNICKASFKFVMDSIDGSDVKIVAPDILRTHSSPC